jgi:hypothetical protein
VVVLSLSYYVGRPIYYDSLVKSQDAASQSTGTVQFLISRQLLPSATDLKFKLRKRALSDPGHESHSSALLCQVTDHCASALRSFLGIGHTFCVLGVRLGFAVRSTLSKSRVPRLEITRVQPREVESSVID